MDYTPPRSSPPTTQPFRYISLAQDADDIVDEKTPSTREHRKKRPTSLSRQPSRSDAYHDYLHPHTSSHSGGYPSAHWTPWTPYYADAQSSTRQSHPYSLRSPSLSASRFLRQPSSPISLPTHNVHSYPPVGPGIVSTMRPWLPLIMYAISSLAFVVAIALYRTELFTCTSLYFYFTDPRLKIPQSSMISLFGYVQTNSMAMQSCLVSFF